MSSEVPKFSPQDITELKALLRIDGDAADQAARALGLCLVMYQVFDKTRRDVPDYRAARSRVEHIASAAARLKRYLNEVPEIAAEGLVTTWLPARQVHPADVAEALGDTLVPVPRREDERLNKVSDFLATLTLVQKNAEAWSDDDSLFRRVHLLQPTRDAGKSIEVGVLWPLLFRHWENAGRQLAKTKDGPLHRFIALVHRVGGLGPPKASTLKDAVEDYRRNRRRAD